MYEYGIVHHNLPNKLHRGPMTKVEADQWIWEWIQDGGKPGVFVMVCRFVGEWLLV